MLPAALPAGELGEQPLAAGALTVSHAEQASWARADPVHLRVMRDHALLLPGAALSLSPAEADALREALNRHFAARLALHDAGGQRWIARLEGELESHEISPLEAQGREIEIGAQGARAAALLNEAQMLLHAHPVNEAREARGEPQLNSLWLWGGGRAPRAAQGRWRSVSADDPVALGLAKLAGAHVKRVRRLVQAKQIHHHRMHLRQDLRLRVDRGSDARRRKLQGKHARRATDANTGDVGVVVQTLGRALCVATQRAPEVRERVVEVARDQDGVEPVDHTVCRTGLRDDARCVPPPLDGQSAGGADRQRVAV